MKTRGVVFRRADTFDVTDLSLPDPGPRDVAVRTLATSISPGTERWILRGKHAGTQFPCVPGYHRIGIVEECGSRVTDLQVGDVVYGAGSRWEEKEIDIRYGLCDLDCDLWRKEWAYKINPKMTCTRTAWMVEGDPYCELVYEIKE